MNFVIDKFLRLLLDYHIDFKHTPKGRYSHEIALYNLDPELKKILLQTTYQNISGIRETKTNRTNVVRMEPMTSTEYCLVEKFDNNATNDSYLLMVLTENDYGDKICKVDFTIKRFIERHSPIDIINHN